jgi:hypothetical protein
MKKTVDDKLNDIFDVQGKIVEQAFPVAIEQPKDITGAPTERQYRIFHI